MKPDRSETPSSRKEEEEEDDYRHFRQVQPIHIQIVAISIEIGLQMLHYSTWTG